MKNSLLAKTTQTKIQWTISIQLLILFNLFFLQTYGQYGQPIFKYAKGAANDYAVAWDISTDACGSSYITGEYTDTITFGNLPTLSSGGAFLVKYDPLGNALWAHHVDGDRGRSVSQDAAGNAYITGAIGDSFFLAKYNDAGTLLWNKVLGGNALIDYLSLRGGSFVSADASGVAYVGYQNGNMGAAVSIFDASGNTIGGAAISNCSYILNVGTNSSGSCFYITGVSNVHDSSFFVSKFDNSGNLQWTNYAYSTNYIGTSFGTSGIGTDVYVDATGNAYISGSAFYSCTLDFGGGNVLDIRDPGFGPVYMVKYNAGGTTAWVRKISSATADPGHYEWAVGCADVNGNTYLVSNEIVGDSVSIGGTRYYVQGGSGYISGGDICIAKLLPSGQVEWIERVKTDGCGMGCTGSFSTSADAFGNVYITGMMYGDVSFGNISFNNTGTSMFVSKIGTAGTAVTIISKDTSICKGNSITLSATVGTSYNWFPATGLSATNIANPTANPDSTTTYHLTVNGCLLNDSVTITVNPLPMATITPSGATTFCAGTSTTLSAPLASSYLWSDGSTTQSITVSTSGNYSVTVTDGNGCSATSAPTTVTVNPLPTANAGQDVTIFAGQSATIGSTTVAGYTYNWTPTTGLNDSTLANSTASPTITTTYTLTVTDGNGCSAVDTMKVTVEMMIDGIISRPPQTDTATTKLIFDRFGNTYSKEEIKRGNSTGSPNYRRVTAGIFLLDFLGDGFETNKHANEALMRDAISKAFTDLSTLITPAQCNGQNPIVYIRVTAPSTIPANALGAATSFYTTCCPGDNSGIIDGDVWKAINTGVNEPDVFDGEVFVNFNQPWNFDFTCTTGICTTQYDVYSVYLHEAIHLLGFNTLIGANGQSISPPAFSNHYSRFDTYLKSISGNTNFINWNNCYSATLNVPVSDIGGTTAGCTNIRFVTNTGNQPVYAPTTGYEQGSSLSHFQNNCGGANNYVMNPSLAMGVFHRVPTAEEVRALCAIGYNTTGTFGSVTTLPACGQIVAGVDDGYPNTCTNQNYVVQACSTNTITINPIANDRGTQSFACLRIVEGGGSVSVTSGTSFVYTPPATPDIITLTYVPVGTNNQRGNITCIRIIVTPCSTTTCATPANCNQICNPDFTNPVNCGTQSRIDCQDYPFNNNGVNGWRRTHGSPQIFDVSSPNVISPDFAFTWANSKGNLIKGEGIAAFVQVQPNQKYVFSYRREHIIHETSTYDPLDNIHVYLVQFAVFSPSIIWQDLIPKVPNPHFEILHETNIISTTWEQVTVCFTTPNDNINYDFLWIYPEQNSLHDASILKIDRVSLIEDNFTVGTDVTIPCGDVLIGENLCPVAPSTQYEWRISGNTAVIGTYSQLQLTGALQPHQTTTYNLTRTFPANPTTVVFPTQRNCTVTGTVTVTVNNPIVLVTNTTPTCTGTANGTATVTVSGGTAPYIYEWNINGVIRITPTVTNLAAGQYTVTVTDAKGCMQTATATVNNLPLPNVAITPSSTTPLCEKQNQSITLSASGAVSYTWSPATGLSCTQCSTTIAKPATTTTYTVTGTATNGCTNTASYTVVVDPMPTATITGATTICHPGIQNVTLSASGGTNYTWSTGETTADIIVSPIKTTSYTVTVTSAGCPGSATDNATVKIDCKNCTYPSAFTLGFKNTTTTYTGGQSFNGEWNVAGDIILSNGTYTLNPGTVFYVEGNGKGPKPDRMIYFPFKQGDWYQLNNKTNGIGVSIYLDNATLIVNGATITAACNKMWGGIFPYNTFTSVNHIQISNSSEISNSVYGVAINGDISTFDIRESRFHNNYASSIGISRLYKNYAGTEFIQHNTFMSESNTMFIPYNWKSDYEQYYAFSDIVLFSGAQHTIEISDNTFENSMFGVISYELTSCTIHDNKFTNNFIGGIYIWGTGHAGSIYTTGSTFKKNEFNFPTGVLQSIQTKSMKGKTIGIYAGSGDFDISGGNIFNGNRGAGIFQEAIVSYDRFYTRTVSDNEIHDVNNGVHEVGLDASVSSKIENNLFDGANKGVRVAPNTPYTTPNLQIHCNTFDKGASTTAYGIFVANGGLLNDQGACTGSIPPAGNKFDNYSGNSYTLQNKNTLGNNPFTYNKASNEIVTNFDPNGIMVNLCTTTPITCGGAYGTKKMDDIVDVNQLVTELKNKNTSVGRQRELTGEIINYYHKNKQCGSDLEKLTDDMLSINKMAYNAFSWHLVDCYADKGNQNKATDKKDKVVKNNKNDDDMNYRNRFYDIVFKLEHLTTSSSYQITEDDIDELVKISQSNTSFSLAACYMLIPFAPDKVDCFDNADVQGSYKMSTEIETIKNNNSEAVLGNNIPNPFSNTTVIPYYLPSGNKGTIQISSIQGKVLRSYPLQEGENKLEITTTGLENGIYFYSMVVNNIIILNKKMVIIK